MIQRLIGLEAARARGEKVDRSASESTSNSENSIPRLPNSRSLLGGIKRMFKFFVISEDAMEQAGINLGYSHLSDTENSVNPPVETNNTDSV